jgi:hypothetical protein
VSNIAQDERSFVTGGGGPYLFIALPLIGMGAYLTYLGITQTIFLIIGPIFLLLGSLLAIFREGITLDRLQGTATQWRKLISRKIIAVHNLSEFRTIEIEMRRAAKGTTYIVSLAGNSKKVVVNYPISSERARKIASEIANFLAMAIVDKTISGADGTYASSDEKRE